MKHADTPFRIDVPLRRVPTVGPMLLGAAERALAFERLANIYRQLNRPAAPADLAWQALELLQVRFDFDAAQLDRVPRSGPGVVVANHPYGGLDGLFLIAALLKHRPDARFIANELLGRIPELKDVLLPVDAFAGVRAAIRNASAVRAALRHVQQGGLLVLFPAGAVSHLHLSEGRVCDSPWSAAAARLIRLCDCPVTPIHFGGGNSAIFQALGLLHPRLRTVMLSRELLNKRRRTIPVAIGRTIAPGRLARIADDGTLARFLRLSVEALGRDPLRQVEPSDQAPTAPRAPPALIETEMDWLLEHQALAAMGEMTVVFARSDQIAWTLRELGVLREIAFRAVGEGAGRDCDVDRYDAHYVHLIAWDRARKRIVGAYRIGHVDEIVAAHGRKGLYSRSLFAYGEAFLRELGPALELGRSFVTPEYQKDFGALLLLWRGIAAYVARQGRYHVLFGPVSISADYSRASHAVLIEYLRCNFADPKLAMHVRARRPFRRSHSLAPLSASLARLTRLEDIGGVLEHLEHDGKGVPVLLRQYLKLGGRLVGFNVDQHFSDAIDGLVVVDLLRTERRTLEKYMGRETAARFLARQAGDGLRATGYRQRRTRAPL